MSTKKKYKQGKQGKQSKKSKKSNNNKILFIIFPGHFTTREHFKLDTVDDIKYTKNSNFIRSLEKMGKIHFAEQNWNNLKYYDKNIPEEKSNFMKNIDFTLKDLDIKNIITKIYNQVNNFKGKYVLISHSIGAISAYYFSQTYSSRCIGSFIIDGIRLGSKIPFLSYSIEDEKEIINNIKKYKKITNKEIKDLIDKSRNYDSDAIYKLGDITACKLFEQAPKKAKVLLTKTFSFRNFEIPNYKELLKKKLKYDLNTDYLMRKYIPLGISEAEYLSKHNPERYRYMFFINKSHYPHLYKDSREIILNTIKCFIT